MTNSPDPLNEYLAVLKSFEENKVEYILVGGVAVILHGLPRYTADLDIFIKVVPGNIKNLRKALKILFTDDASIDEITHQELDQFPVIRYGPPDGNYFIDIMTKIGEAFCYDDLEYEIIEVNGVKIRIATVDTLFKMKKNTLREKDKMDAFFLKERIEKNKSKEK